MLLRIFEDNEVHSLESSFVVIDAVLLCVVIC